MDAYFIEVKNVAKKMVEVNVKLIEDIVVYHTIKNLPKEYDVFREVQHDKQQLSTYEELESKLLQKELNINSKDNENQRGEALTVKGRINFYDQSQRYPSWVNFN
jgi:nitrogenase subunit NifH